MKKVLSVLFLTAALLSNINVKAQVVSPVDKNKLANGGYDMVSYFTDSAAQKGKPEFTAEIKGVKYQFASAEHKNIFLNNPDKYLPVCDGYCAWGVAAKGKRVPVNPQTYKVIDGKLYLFFNGDFNSSPFNTLPEWNKDQDKLLTQLPVNWAKLNATTN